MLEKKHDNTCIHPAAEQYLHLQSLGPCRPRKHHLDLWHWALPGELDLSHHSLGLRDRGGTIQHFISHATTTTASIKVPHTATGSQWRHLLTNNDTNIAIKLAKYI